VCVCVCVCVCLYVSVCVRTRASKSEVQSHLLNKLPHSQDTPLALPKGAVRVQRMLTLALGSAHGDDQRKRGAADTTTQSARTRSSVSKDNSAHRVTLETIRGTNGMNI
jgi:hypothetical protein